MTSTNDANNSPTESLWRVTALQDIGEDRICHIHSCSTNRAAEQYCDWLENTGGEVAWVTAVQKDMTDLFRW